MSLLRSGVLGWPRSFTDGLGSLEDDYTDNLRYANDEDGMIEYLAFGIPDDDDYSYTLLKRSLNGADYLYLTFNEGTNEYEWRDLNGVLFEDDFNDNSLSASWVTNLAGGTVSESSTGFSPNTIHLDPETDGTCAAIIDTVYDDCICTVQVPIIIYSTPATVNLRAGIAVISGSSSYFWGYHYDGTDWEYQLALLGAPYTVFFTTPTTLLGSERSLGVSSTGGVMTFKYEEGGVWTDADTISLVGGRKFGLVVTNTLDTGYACFDNFLIQELVPSLEDAVRFGPTLSKLFYTDRTTELGYYHYIAEEYDSTDSLILPVISPAPNEFDAYIDVPVIETITVNTDNTYTDEVALIEVVANSGNSSGNVDNEVAAIRFVQGTESEPPTWDEWRAYVTGATYPFVLDNTNASIVIWCQVASRGGIVSLPHYKIISYEGQGSLRSQQEVETFVIAGRNTLYPTGFYSDVVGEVAVGKVHTGTGVFTNIAQSGSAFPVSNVQTTRLSERCAVASSNITDTYNLRFVLDMQTTTKDSAFVFIGGHNLKSFTQAGYKVYLRAEATLGGTKVIDVDISDKCVYPEIHIDIRDLEIAGYPNLHPRYFYVDIENTTEIGVVAPTNVLIGRYIVVIPSDCIQPTYNFTDNATISQTVEGNFSETPDAVYGVNVRYPVTVELSLDNYSLEDASALAYRYVLNGKDTPILLYLAPERLPKAINSETGLTRSVLYDPTPESNLAWYCHFTNDAIDWATALELQSATVSFKQAVLAEDI